MPLTAKDIRNNEQLKADGLAEDEIKRFRKAEQNYYIHLVDLDEANSAKDYEKVIDLEKVIIREEFLLKYQGKDPKQIPQADLKALVAEFESEDSNINAYHRKIKSPPSGIRSYCVWCMGGQTAEVRRCQATNCPLWPFRMGTNPFAGKTLPPVEDVELEDDDKVEVEEDTNEDDD